GYYTIENAFSGLYLTDNGNGQLVQALQNNADSQLWQLKASGSNYVLMNKITGRVVDDPGLNVAQGVGIITWPPNGGPNQSWTIK
ncbi:MAG: RICIN domain-containing protein, partial [Bryobacteraceae bacterium]